MRFNRSRSDLRRTNPLFHDLVFVCALGAIALAANFWRYTPTFNPKVLTVTPPKDLVGIIFLVLGVAQLVCLIVLRDLHKLRLVLAVSAGFTCCWGLANTQQAFAGKASLQLPILLVVIFSATQLLLLIHAPVDRTNRP